MQLVRDEDDRKALAGELLQRREQRLAFLGGEHRRRFIEDEDAGLAIEDFQYLDALSFADRQLGDGLVGLDREAEIRRQHGQAPAGL